MRGGPCLTERWWAKFEREPGTGCWLWTAAVGDPRIKARVAASGCGTADFYAIVPTPAAIRATA